MIRIIQGDCRDALPTLPAESIHMVCTSPPYWGLRSYLPAGHPDKAREIGQEKRLDCLGWARGENCGACYICTLRGVFAGVWRVLRDDGTLWVNQGDSYHNGDKGGYLTERSSKSAMQQSNLANDIVGAANRQPQPGLKPKDLCAQPWRLALALQADGWFWRDEIIWHKKSCMPSSQRDRCTRSHEVVLMFSKRERYFYDIEAIKEDSVTNDPRRPYGSEGAWEMDGRPVEQRHGGELRALANRKRGEFGGKTSEFEGREAFRQFTVSRTKRSVWSLGPEPFKESHFATFPSKLVEPCILAGTSERGVCPGCGAQWERVSEKGEYDFEHQRACGGDANGKYDGQSTKDYAAANAQDASATKARILAGMRSNITMGWQPTCKCGLTETVPATVLDIFGGAGTVGLVADRLQRNAVLIELNADYSEMAKTRLTKDSPMFANIS